MDKIKTEVDKINSTIMGKRIPLKIKQFNFTFINSKIFYFHKSKGLLSFVIFGIGLAFRDMETDNPFFCKGFEFPNSIKIGNYIIQYLK